LKSIYSIQNTVTPASFKDIDGKKGIVSGYFANFNSKDSDGDIIVKGAFAKSIGDMGPQSAKPRIKHLLNHNVEQPLGSLIVLKEDMQGLYYESQVGTHTLGTDFIKMVESGLITEHSIGFRLIPKEQGGYKYDGDTRIIQKTQLMEGSSLTGWGANEFTPLIGMKSLSELNLDTILEKQKRIEKFCKDSDATDETIELLLIHSKQLSQTILDIQSTKQANDATKQEQDLKRLFDTINNFNKQL
jgi:uncharacterized protein